MAKETIRKKAMRAWLNQSEIEVISKNGKVNRGHITEVCGGFFRASYDGESELHVPRYGNVSDILFLDETEPEDDVAKGPRLDFVFYGGGWYVYDRNQCVGLGKYKCVAVIDRDVPEHERESYARKFAAALEMLDVLEMMERHITNTEGAYPEGCMVLMLHESILGRIGEVIKKARGG